MNPFCAIDWAALGSWAAVVVALFISVRDILEKRAQRKAEAIIVATLICSDLLMMSVRVRHIVSLLPDDKNELWKLTAILMTNRAERQTLGNLGSGLVMKVVDRSVERLFSLPPDFSRAIALAISSLSELRDTLHTVRDEESNEEATKHYAELIPILAEYARTADKNLDEAINKCRTLTPNEPN
jgi:uncharacterized membrane protein